MSESTSAASSNPWVERLVRFLPLLIFFVCFGFRLIGIGWGMPNGLHHQTYHPDEMPNWQFAQEIDPAGLDFTPGSYSYGTFYLTVLKVASDVVKGYGGGPVEGNPDSNWDYIGRCLFAGRLLNAAFGALAAAFAFLTFRRWMKPLSAAIGALVLGFAPGFVIHSRFATVDVLATLLVVASAHFALLLIPIGEPDELQEVKEASKRLRWVAMSGALAGLSAGTKYTGVLALLTLYAALWLHKRPGILKAAIQGTAMAVLAFVASTPGVLVDTANFWQGFTFELQHSATGHGLVFVGRPPGFIYHIYNLIEGVGPAIVLAAVIGLILMPPRIRKAGFALLAFALVYYIAIGRSQVMFLRYTFPLLLALGFGLGALLEWANDKSRNAFRWVSAIGMLLVGGVPIWGGLRESAVATVWMAGEDPRDTAAKYLKSELEKAPGSTVGIVRDPWFDTPPLFPDTGLPRPIFRRLIEAIQQNMRAEGVVQYLPPNIDERFDWDARLLTELKPAYVTASSFAVEDLERLKGMSGLEPQVQLQVDRYKAFLEVLERDYTADAVFGGGLPPIHDLEYVRPVIWVWKRKATP